jgi:hypothetical protein
MVSPSQIGIHRKSLNERSVTAWQYLKTWTPCFRCWPHCRGVRISSNLCPNLTSNSGKLVILPHLHSKQRSTVNKSRMWRWSWLVTLRDSWKRKFRSRMKCRSIIKSLRLANKELVQVMGSGRKTKQSERPPSISILIKDHFNSEQYWIEIYLILNLNK